jgi:hypothetical protein
LVANPGEYITDYSGARTNAGPNAGDAEYHSASGEGQFTATGRLVGGTL